MRKSLIFIMLLALCFAFSSCGSSETADEPTALSYTDIQVEDADGVNVYSVIYDIDNTDTEAWSGYDTDEMVAATCVDGVKACLARDDWKDGSIVYGYANEPLLKNILYQYGFNGIDGDYETIRLYQVGIYNDDFVLTDELE